MPCKGGFPEPGTTTPVSSRVTIGAYACACVRTQEGHTIEGLGAREQMYKGHPTKPSARTACASRRDVPWTPNTLILARPRTSRQETGQDFWTQREGLNLSLKVSLTTRENRHRGLGCDETTPRGVEKTRKGNNRDTNFSVICFFASSCFNRIFFYVA